MGGGKVTGSARIIAGIGCRRGCPGEEIAALVHQAAMLSGCEPTALAAPDFKSNEPGLHDAAGRLRLDLLLVSATELAASQPRCVTRSARAAAATGAGSVAEGSALAAAGPHSRLALARIASARATCAIAISA